MGLINAIKRNNIKAVVGFLEGGADPSHFEDAAMITPLHYAVVYNVPDAIPILIGAGADLKAKTSEGMTPLDYAKYHKHTDLVDLLMHP